jgi:hypothetical protein
MRNTLAARYEEINQGLISLLLGQSGTIVNVVTEAECLGLVKDNYRVIRIDHGPQTGLDLSFIDPAFIRAARLGATEIGKLTIGSTFCDIDMVSYRSKAIADASISGNVSMLSPFHGTIVKVDGSLGQEWCLQIADGDPCMASTMGSTMTAVHLETVWVFPKHGVLLCVQNGLADETIVKRTAEQIFRCLKYSEGLSRYLSAEQKRERHKIAVTDFWCPHMSHNLWNIQTGWANVFALGSPNSISEFLLYKNQNFFGSLAELFPESVPDESKILWVENEDDVFREMLEKNLLLLTIKDEFFNADFAARVRMRAYESCSQEFLEEAARFRAKCRPVILTTIRLDNRAWIEQKEGFPALFSRIREDYPDLGIVIDGLSSDTAKGWTTSWMSMQSELAREISSQLPDNMPIMFGVGRTFGESIVLMDLADFFIAPSGSGMAIYKWVLNKPGLAFSNKAVLDEASPHRWPLRVWHDRTFRRDMVPTMHLPHEFVRDGDIARNHISRANFHLDWMDLFRNVGSFLEQYKSEK